MLKAIQKRRQTRVARKATTNLVKETATAIVTVKRNSSGHAYVAFEFNPKEYL
jgi:hypothetical protein